MADRRPYPDTGDDTGVPRWVKVSGIIGIVLVLVFIIVMFIGGGSHGPGRHTLSDSPDDHTPPIEHAVQQP